jgi:tRNA-guanine family transglycosylase
MHFIATKEELSSILISKHNIRYLIRLMGRMRDAIQNETLEEFVKEYFKKRYKEKKKVPEWILYGMTLAEFNLDDFNF